MLYHGIRCLKNLLRNLLRDKKKFIEEDHTIFCRRTNFTERLTSCFQMNENCKSLLHNKMLQKQGRRRIERKKTVEVLKKKKRTKGDAVEEETNCILFRLIVAR